jgi:hypothetical protein
LHIGAAYLFFSGIGLLILELCASIGPNQREALRALIESTGNVLLPVAWGRELEDLHLQEARAQTLCEMALPLNFNTMAHHALMEVFLPERGHVARVGSTIHSHMVVYERFNKLLRRLLTQMKAPQKHLMLSILRLRMIECARVVMPPGYFPTAPETSSILGALRAGCIDEERGPDYIRFERIVRAAGRMKQTLLAPPQMDQVHRFFLEEHAPYAEAHRKLAGIRPASIESV